LHSADDNVRSFWLLKEDLIRSIRESGFAEVIVQPDGLGNVGEEESVTRKTFIGIKTA